MDITKSDYFVTEDGLDRKDPEIECYDSIKSSILINNVYSGLDGPYRVTYGSLFQARFLNKTIITKGQVQIKTYSDISILC